MVTVRTLGNLGANPISTRATMAVAEVNRTLALRATPQFALDQQGHPYMGQEGGRERPARQVSSSDRRPIDSILECRRGPIDSFLVIELAD